MTRVTSRPSVAGRRTAAEPDMSPQVARFHRLLLSFPALKRAGRALIASDGDPWDQNDFVRWACCDASTQEQHAARFMLSLFDPNRDWSAYARQELGIRDAITHRVGPFDVIEAMGAWDKANRAAFNNWAQEPFWP